jgi:hypothetical protein
MLVGMHIYNGDAGAMRRQQAAVSALARLSGVEGLNVQFRAGLSAALPGIETMAALDQDSMTTVSLAGRRKPLTRELFEVFASVAADRGHRYFAYINSDIIVLPAVLDAVERLARETYAVSRHDVDHAADAKDGTLLTSGLDMFVLSCDWWQRHRRRFRSYVVGDACWDNVYSAIMMCHSDGVILNRDRLILHERHAALWHDESATARYNGYMAALDARYFSLWCEYWERLEQARRTGASAAQEQALRDEVFVWRRSAADAVQQSIRGVRAWLKFRRVRDPQLVTRPARPT